MTANTGPFAEDVKRAMGPADIRERDVATDRFRCRLVCTSCRTEVRVSNCDLPPDEWPEMARCPACCNPLERTA